MVIPGCEKKENPNPNRPKEAWGSKWVISCKDPFGESLFENRTVWSKRNDLTLPGYIEYYWNGKHYYLTSGHSCQIYHLHIK